MTHKLNFDQFKKLTDNCLIHKVEMRLKHFFDVDLEYYYNTGWTPEELADHLIQSHSLFEDDEVQNTKNDTAVVKEATVATKTETRSVEELRVHFKRMAEQYRERRWYFDHNGVRWKTSDGILALFRQMQSMGYSYIPGE